MFPVDRSAIILMFQPQKPDVAHSLCTHRGRNYVVGKETWVSNESMLSICVLIEYLSVKQCKVRTQHCLMQLWSAVFLKLIFFHSISDFFLMMYLVYFASTSLLPFSSHSVNSLCCFRLKLPHSQASESLRNIDPTRERKGKENEGCRGMLTLGFQNSVYKERPKEKRKGKCLCSWEERLL